MSFHLSLACVCGLVFSAAGLGQPKLPVRLSSSCIAVDTWSKLAAQQLSKTRQVGPVAMSPDGKTLVLSIKDGVFSRILAFDLTSSSILWDHPLDDPADLLTVAYDGSQVAARTGVHCKGVPLHHWELRTGKDLPALAQDSAFAGQVWPSTIAYGGNLVAASVSMTGDIQIWSASSGQTAKMISGNFAGLIEHQGLASLLLSTDGKQLLAGGSGRILRWQLPDATKLSDISGVGNMPVTDMTLSPDGNRLAVGTHASLTILDLKAAKILQTFAAPWTPLRFDQSETLLLADKTKTARWGSGEAVVSVQSLPAGVRRVLASSDGTLVGLSVEKATEIHLIYINKSTSPRTLALPGR